MHIYAIKTRRVDLKDNLYTFLDDYLPALKENTILAITSKILSVLENRVVSKETSKKELIEQEADYILKTSHPQDFVITLTQGILIPTAGIDESNANEHYILYPKNPYLWAEQIWQYLKNRYHLKQIGVVVTDSHSTPMRRGITGFGLAFCGFKPLYSYVGQPDLDGRPLKVSQVNVLDALGSMAVFAMGEGSEQTPLAIIEHAPRIQYVQNPPSEEDKKSVLLGLDEDLYLSAFKEGFWVKKK